MTVLDYVKYAETSRRAAAEGAVLLKNEGGVLPILPEQTVALFGRTQYDTIYCGTGSGGLVNVPYVVSIHQGLSEVRSLEPVSQEAYAAWLPDHPFDEGQGWAATPWSQDEMTVSPELAALSAGGADLAVVVIGRTAGEDRDNVAKKGAYYLTDTELEVLRNVRQAFSRLAVVLNTGNIIDMSWQKEIRPDAILSVWQGGCEVGHAVADVLTGKVNPSGKLPDTVAYSLEDYPASGNFGGAHEIVYAEDIYVGYRYFETFAPDKVLYPFGFGLSYSTFDFDLEGFESGDEAVNVSASLKNTGSPEGKSVLQLYVQAPQGKLGQPLRKLVSFSKSRTLGSGERELMRFEVQVSDLASFDDSGVSGHRNAYVLEAGDYEFFLGFDVRSAVSCGVFSVPETRLMEQLQEVMAPSKPFKRLRPEAAGETFMEASEDAPVRSVAFEHYIDERSQEAEAQHDNTSSFQDWIDGKVSLDEYLGQFSDLDLIHLARGIGMAPSGVTPGIAGAFGGVSTRLKASGMPLAACADGPSGIRMDNGAMAFSVPNGTALAATFDLELNRELFEYLALELRKNNIESLLGPGMNIHRHPLNGRNFEYFSEDPLLTGLMADAQVAGMLRHRVSGTVKHFALNNQEYRRNDADSIASQRAIREIYLKPFEILVKRGNLRSLMTSYNPINGVWAASNYELNTVILREEWGFDGIVMTDWWAKMNWSPGEPGDRKHVGAMIRAQNDLYMVNLDAETNRNGDLAEDEYRQGRFTRADLLRNAKNICMFIRDYHHDLHPLTLQVLNEPQLEDNVLVRIDAGKVDRHTVLEAAELTGKKGGSIAVAFEAQHYGPYSLKLRFRSETTEVGQMNVTVSLNNIPAQTISLRGAGVFEETVGFHIGQNPNNYIDIYFSEGGLIIEGAELVYEG